MGLRPADEAELAEAVAAAAAEGRGLAIRGGATRAGLGHAVTGDPLETGGLSGIRLYEPGALTLVAGAGTPLEEVEAALAAENQRLPFEPMDHRALYGTNGAPTIGGVVAANVSGPRRIQAGACRDSLIGVRFVDGRGTVLKNGGRVMKNVTGYDLVKLMAGSHGTLGVLTEVAFKLLPAPERSATHCLHGLTDTAAVAAMSAALGSPFDVTGAAHIPGAEDGPVTLIRIEGFEASVAYRAGQLRELLTRYSDEITDSDDPVLWTQVRDARPLGEGAGDVWRVSVKPSDGPEVRRRAGLDHPAFYDWGGGLVWLRVPTGEDLRTTLQGVAGHATLVRSDEETKARMGVFHPEPAPLAKISAGLRAQFDPKGVLNPGRMGATG